MSYFRIEKKKRSIYVNNVEKHPHTSLVIQITL